jgi:chromosome segregation ATPase
LSAARYRERMAELNVEIERLQHEITRKQAKGKSTDDLEKKLDELEREKHDLVERIGELSIA